MKTLEKPYDEWESYHDIDKHGKLTLSNIEFTTTNLCNMRCAHCAVGYTLQTKEDEAIPTSELIKHLDTVETLRVMSFTGGEPLLTKRGIRNNLLPLLKYAKSRGIKTQINSNLTLPMEHYEMVAPYLDVIHISHNWCDEKEFVETGFAIMERKPTVQQRAELYRNIFDNARELSKGGMFVSAETMLNRNTVPYIEKIHNEVANEMLCKRHEIHPMYSSDFASNLETINLDEYREVVNNILDFRNEDIWVLFGTLPFYACSSDQRDLALLEKINKTPNITVRNDVDGRSRMNLNIFTGDISVSDFSDDGSALGNIKIESLENIYNRWLDTNISNSINCHCPAVKCLGSNIIVKNMYYPDNVFSSGSVK
ncbi:radical SAM/CxCxxxxC motif protein YfkAB [Lysinibacillus sp. KCTC 33748]|uniref:radical SAM/CxCxxxxC motif protein YfkAB n=1 Tax=unclassified Lysinibacillus TaxID=2636778 RepID=UPI0009A57378|nr:MULTISPECIES: radical SAM/CxCxxxxC motif protein YfkAB [unclassified Lysinibacillus]OXS73094.1 radical SAM/CxCxxxxC motif protein YfkAB [Lysinibacillus sp. KCTC 33748]SKB87472.1 radical SAM/CxCxxxxC motif protein YfkAB [Lysinibacillus sp. AC-3]